MRRIVSLMSSCAALIIGFAVASSAAQITSNIRKSPAPRVEIRQLHQVEQGGSGWFKIQIDSCEKGIPITLPYTAPRGNRCGYVCEWFAATVAEECDEVEVRGLIASDLAGGLTLTAWSDGESTPLAISFFASATTLSTHFLCRARRHRHKFSR